MTSITVVCDNPDCNNSIELHNPSQIKHLHHFCCNACKYAWLSKKMKGDKNPSKRPDVREKISAARKGHEVTPETREKIYKAATKQFSDPEVRSQCSIRLKQYYKDHPDWNPMNSAEARKKISDHMKQNNPVYMPGVLEKISETKKKWHKDHPGYGNGSNNHNWKGGLSYYPYCPKFNEEFKNRVRAYFDYECVVCGKPEWENKNHYHHHVHHVDYNKDACCDGQPVQFVTLCHSCHMKTNGSRSRWEKMFLKILYEIYNNRSYFTKEEWKKIISSTKD